MNNTHGLIAGGRKELMRKDVEEQFGKDQNETDRIDKRAVEAEDKINDANGAPDCLSVTKGFMSAYRQRRRI